MTFSPFPQRSADQSYLIDEAIRELESVKPIMESAMNSLYTVAKKIDVGSMHMTAMQIWSMANDAKRHLKMIDRIVESLNKKRAL
jgi:hypothetical protein